MTTLSLWLLEVADGHLGTGVSVNPIRVDEMAEVSSTVQSAEVLAIDRDHS